MGRTLFGPGGRFAPDGGCPMNFHLNVAPDRIETFREEWRVREGEG